MPNHRRVRVPVACLALAAVVLIGCGRQEAVVDRDLELSANGRGFSGGFDRAEWRWDQDSAEKRSEWLREDGQALVVWARPLRGTLEEFAEEYDRQRGEGGLSSTERTLMGGVEVLRSSDDVTGDDGEALRELRFFVHDPEGRDVHMVQVICWPEDADALAIEVAAVLASARWVPALDTGHAPPSGR